MLLQQELDRAGKTREIQVFATDVNDQALEKAREGTYPATIATDVPAEYLAKFCTSSEDGLSFTINKEIRQLVVFAKQDILTDPPFSRLDLVICRNLLIYLEPDAQEKCVALFHYALKEGGYLFLGGAESPGRNKGLFVSLAHKKCRIYRKIETKTSTRTPLAVPFASEHLPLPAKRTSSPGIRPSVIELSQEVLLDEFAPAAVTINQNYDILYNNGPTSTYLHQPRGPLTSSLLELLPENARNRIRGAIYRAGQDGKAVAVRADVPDDSGRIRQATIRISNLREGLYLVIFREKGSPSNAPEEISPDVIDMEEAAVRQLERELSTTRDDLQSHIEQLKSLNEELHSSNEELQAANEELETSREELQSLNEELTTVNTQLQTKIEDEEETNNDLNNFLASTNIPTIFLDHQLRVKRYTPAMSRLIKLLPGDVGRPIIDMSQAHLGPDLVSDARSVLDNLTPATREFGINGVWYVRNILPYRTSDNRIEGVVITYVDISERKRAELSLSESEARYRELVDNANSIIIRMDRNGVVTFFNEYARKFFGYSRDEIIGRSVKVLLPDTETATGRDLDEMADAILENPDQFVENINENVRKNGDRVWVSWRNRAIKDSRGDVIGNLAIGQDITERKAAEEALGQSRAKLDAALASMSDAIFIADAEGRFIQFNDAFVTYHRFRDREECSKKIEDCANYLDVYFADGTPARPDMWAMPRALRGETASDVEYMLRRKDTGETWWGSYNFAPIKGKDGEMAGAVVVGREITDRKAAERRLQDAHRLLADVIDGSPSPIFLKDREGKFITVNAPLEKMLGMTREELKGKTDYDIATKEMADYWRAHDEQVMRTGQPLQIEEEADLKDGHHVFLANKFPLVDVSEQICGVCSISHDITAQRQAEAALRENEQRLRMFYESGLVGMFSWHLDGRITEVNDRFLQMVGYSREDFEAGRMKWAEMTPPEYWPLDQHAMEELRETGLNTPYEKEFIRRDGSRIPIVIGAATVNEDRTQGVSFLLDNTERRKAEESLLRSEGRWNTAIEHFGEGAIIATEAEQVIYWNPAARAMHGFTSADEGIGPLDETPNTFQLWTPDGHRLLPLEEWPMKRIKRGETVRNLELRLRRPDQGWERIVSYSGAMVETTRSERLIFLSVHDLTEQRKAEEKTLRQTTLMEGINRIFQEAITCESEEQLGTVCLSVAEELTGSKIGFIGEIHPDGQLYDITISNPGWDLCRMYDSTGHRRPPGTFKIHGLYGHVLEHGRSLLTNDPAVHSESIGLPEGHPPLTAFLGVPLVEKGKTIGLVGVGNREGGYSPEHQQILEDLAPAIVQALLRKRAEDEVRKSRDELEQRVLERTETLRRQAGLLELAYNAIIVRDLNSKITFWNARAEEIYGFTRDEALGQVTHMLLQTRFPVPFEEHMAVLAEKGRWEGEVSHTTKDGRQIIVASRQALQRDETGRPVAVMDINLDITEQRRVEEHLRQAQKMEALGTLSGGIAHDFNNILAAIIGFTELVASHVDQGSRDAHSLERVMEAAIRGRELVRQMLTFSRKTEHEKKPVRLSAIVRESVRLLRAAVLQNPPCLEHQIQS
jgi:PAS domain S-box-containing protein